MAKLVKKFLILVGKPFYWALELIVLSLLTCFSLIFGLAGKIKVVWPKPKFPTITIKIKPRVLLAVSFLTFLFSIFYFLILKELPSPSSLKSRQLDVSTRIYDRNGVLLYKIYKDQNRTLIHLADIPIHVRLATLAAEDAEFYSHPGFSIKGIFRSLVRNIKVGELSGGSTITQQLVKNALLTPEKTLRRKIKEIILAMEVERVFTKDEILEMYLNQVSYGGAAYGIKEAAGQYFAKDVDKLSLAQSAYLAGLTKSPTKLSPYGTNPDLAIEREKEILHLMRINKFITKDQENAVLEEKITIKAKVIDIKAPHFVMYVRQLLVDKYGEDVVEKGGLEVTTSLDLNIQQMAEGVVKTEIEKLKNLKVGNGAALVLNPQTGEVLAMVGSKDYFDPQSGNVNVTLRERQPGSSIKVVNYAYALNNNYTPASIIDDSPTTFVVSGQPPYTPVNYDGAFRGRITLRSALAQSRNVPAVKVLASYGVVKMIEQGQKMGITSWNDPSRFGLSLTLGGGEIKLIDLARVYATLANLGKRPEITPILKVTNFKGETLEENGSSPVQVIDPRVAFMLIDILKDNPARAPEFGLNSYLVIPGHPEVAVKTGTSNNLKDNLTLGFNQKYLVAVWVGNNDATPMSRIASGVTGASPIWNKILSSLLQNEKSENWQIPEGLAQIPCLGRLEWFLAETNTQKLCAPLPAPVPTPVGATPLPQILEPAVFTVQD